MIPMTLTRREKIALEEYIGAAEELYAHLADSDRPPRLAFLVRQLGSAREPLLEVLSPATRHVG
jgi:hypothetical protein